MSRLKVDFVSSATYNNLPRIIDGAIAPKVNSNDLAALRALLSKHKVSDGVSVRLIHRHFDLIEDEVTAFREIMVPPHGDIRIMQPIIPGKALDLYGLSLLRGRGWAAAAIRLLCLRNT
jgi:hypothetical protein